MALFFTASGYSKSVNFKTFNGGEYDVPISINLDLCSSVMWVQQKDDEGFAYRTAELMIPSSEELITLDSEDSERLWKVLHGGGAF